MKEEFKRNEIPMVCWNSGKIGNLIYSGRCIRCAVGVNKIQVHSENNYNLNLFTPQFAARLNAESWTPPALQSLIQSFRYRISWVRHSSVDTLRLPLTHCLRARMCVWVALVISFASPRNRITPIKRHRHWIEIVRPFNLDIFICRLHFSFVHNG